ncbi:hypothetical protein BU16DRAFT_535681 [Lophium mytilinum]|uniref:Uncharacterized protein n=1 Tax=Lophium mytilinum TaxID=390894 RepID=A0A6A6R4M2_9PEZI|nr:hypothetical protein BU16DRAFT_535681 [Lophium mytilinum]
MAANSTICHNLNRIPHTNPESSIFGFAVPWAIAFFFAAAAISSASDAAYLANDEAAATSSATDSIPDDAPSDSIPNDTLSTKELKQPIPSSKAKSSALISTTICLLVASPAFANQILGLLELDYCRPPAAQEHWWLTFVPGAGNPWGATFFYLGTPLFVAAVAWLKTVVNVVAGRRGVYYDDGRWHHHLGLHVAKGAVVAPFVVVVLVVYAVGLLVVGTGLKGVGRRCRSVITSNAMLPVTPSYCRIRPDQTEPMEPVSGQTFRLIASFKARREAAPLFQVLHVCWNKAWDTPSARAASGDQSRTESSLVPECVARAWRRQCLPGISSTFVSVTRSVSNALPFWVEGAFRLFWRVLCECEAVLES